VRPPIPGTARKVRMRTVTRIQRKKTSMPSERRLEGRPISRVAIPSSVMLTPRVLAGAVQKLPSSQIAWLVQASLTSWTAAQEIPTLSMTQTTRATSTSRRNPNPLRRLTPSAATPFTR
jgi:hypothetical protein